MVAVAMAVAVVVDVVMAVVRVNNKSCHDDEAEYAK